MTTLRDTLVLASGLILLLIAADPAHAQTTFGPQQVITDLADMATSVAAADLDGDGDQDVLSAALGDGMIAWYENTDGLGGFHSRTEPSQGSQSLYECPQKITS